MGVDIADINGDLIQDIFTLDMMPYKSDIFMNCNNQVSGCWNFFKWAYLNACLITASCMVFKSPFDCFQALITGIIISFDGSSTQQAEGGSSDCLLIPVQMYNNPTNPDHLVMCEVLAADNTVHPSNTRDAA